MRGQVKIQQKKLAARRRRRALYLSFYSLCALALLIAALSYISSLDALALDAVVVTGNERLSSSTVQSIVSSDLGGTYLGLFPKRDALLYPRGVIDRDLAVLPVVRSAEVSRSGFHTVIVDISERSQAAIWCISSDLATDPRAQCYASDADGFIFARQDPVTSSGDAIYRMATSTDPIGKDLISPDEFRKIRFFMGELAGLAVDPREVVLSGTGSMTVVLGRGGKLVINTADDLSGVLGNIAAVISNRTIAPSLSDFLARLDYMKLDIGNKVVYKLKAR